MKIKLREDHANVDWRELEQLFTLTELAGRKGEKLRRAFLNSQAVCYAYDADRLIGVGRAISDGEYHAFIYDLAVHPAYQRHGVGTLVMHNLLDRLPVWRVMLVAASDVQPFYARFRFVPYSDVMAQLNGDRLFDASAFQSQ